MIAKGRRRKGRWMENVPDFGSKPYDLSQANASQSVSQSQSGFACES